MKFEKWLEETTVAGDIAQPLARGKVDVVGAGCPEGMVKDKKGICVPKGEKISEAKSLKEYQEIYRTDRYDLIAKKIMKQSKGKKITFRDIEQAIIDEFAPQPFDRYDHQEVVDRVKEKRFKVESISKFKEGMVFEAGPRWKYQDSRGVWQTGEFLKFSDRGGTDVTYFFKRDKTGETDVVSGSRLKKAKRIWKKGEGK